MPSFAHSARPGFGRGLFSRLCYILGGLALIAMCQPSRVNAQSPKAGAQQDVWVGAWASPPTDAIATLPIETPPPFANVTLRSTLRISAGGTALRLRISNELGTEPLAIGRVSVLAGNSSRVHPVTFGSGELIIPAGKAVLSDELKLRVKPRDLLTISIHVPGPSPRLTGHVVGQQTVWLAPGDQTQQPKLSLALPGFSRLLLTRVDVKSDRADAGTIAIIGDSISEGYMSSLDTYHRWPDRLVDRMAGTPATRFGVVNLGISGNRLLRDGDGTAVIRRLDRDLLNLPTVKALFVLIGANDLGTPVSQQQPIPTFEELKSGYEAVFAAARQHGAKVYAITILPFGKAGPWYFSNEGEQVRVAINSWLRTGANVDAVIDLAQACAAQGKPSELAPSCDSGDGLHPTDAGYDIMAAAVFKQLAADGFLRSPTGQAR